MAAAPPWRDEAPLRIGISSCLLGREVRYDGGHKRSRYLTDVLAPFVEWVPVCPEVELGLGIPRESIRLERVGDETRLVAPRSGRDHSAAMRRYSRKRTRALAGEDLSGYVLKKDSPSCGMERVRLWREGKGAVRQGRGFFAEALLEAFPQLPVEEEGRLGDPVLRENWIERVFAYRRVRSFFAGRWSLGGLVELHTAHKLQVMAHSPKAYRELGRLVAEAKAMPRAAVRDAYLEGFMAALAQKATRGRNANALQHAAGYFRKQLDGPQRQELAEAIEDYRRGLVPLVVPTTLVRHHVRTLEVAYLAGQVFLDPHPKELMLRNHV